MIYTILTRKAMNIMFEVHKDQRDKSGQPYVFHPFHVAESMDDEISTIVALLHDVVEDSDVTFLDLEKEFPIEVIDILKLLTHTKDEDYFSYINKIKNNKIATKVKISDLTHNMDLTRLDNITEYDLNRQAKYQKALEILKENY